MGVGAEPSTYSLTRPKAIADTHGSTTELIGIKAIVTVKTAIAVCKALDGVSD